MNRREFLRRLGIGTAAVALPTTVMSAPKVDPAPTLMPKPIAYGVSHPLTRLYDEEVDRFWRVAHLDNDAGE